MRISIDGNIAAGKSTAFDVIDETFPDLETFREPVGEWTPLLEKYYEDPATFGFLLSLKILASFCEVRKHGTAISERSPASCRHVFAQMQHDDGTFGAHEWEVFREYMDALGWLPDAIVFVNTPAATCLERVEKRGRPSEVDTITLEYLKRVENKYDIMLRLFKDDIPVITVDGTLPRDVVAQRVVDAVRSLLN
jgi:deoxyadenosine/deoxycytidine kinase